MHQTVRDFRRLITCYASISLVNLSETKHFIKTRQCLGCFGKNHKAAYRSVKSVYHTAKHVAGFVIFLFDITAHYLHKRLITCLVTLNYFTGGLIDHYDMIVFVNYLHIKQILLTASAKVQKSSNMVKTYSKNGMCTPAMPYKANK